MHSTIRLKNSSIFLNLSHIERNPSKFSCVRIFEHGNTRDPGKRRHDGPGHGAQVDSREYQVKFQDFYCMMNQVMALKWIQENIRYSVRFLKHDEPGHGAQIDSGKYQVKFQVKYQDF